MVAPRALRHCDRRRPQRAAGSERARL